MRQTYCPIFSVCGPKFTKFGRHV